MRIIIKNIKINKRKKFDIKYNETIQSNEEEKREFKFFGN